MRPYRSGHQTNPETTPVLIDRLLRESASDEQQILAEAGIREKQEWHAEVEQAVEASYTTGQPVGILFADVDGFKEINDDLGHDIGDEFIFDLRRVFADLKSQFRINDEVRPETPNTPADSVAITVVPGHIGGDEFAALAYTDEAGMSIIKTRLITTFDACLALPTNWRLREKGIGLAVGTATLHPGRDVSAPRLSTSELLQRADHAMFLDKQSHLHELNGDEQTELEEALTSIRGLGIRLRDLPKYAKKYQL